MCSMGLISVLNLEQELILVGVGEAVPLEDDLVHLVAGLRVVTQHRLHKLKREVKGPI